MGIEVQMASERDKYYILVVERAMVVWSFDFHVAVHPEYMKVKLLCDSDALGSFGVDCVHAPAKSASAYSSTPLSKYGVMMMPLSLFSHRSFTILCIACPCARLEFLEYFAH